MVDVDPLRLGSLVDRRSLFLFHWRFRKAGVDEGTWARRVAVELEPMFRARLAGACADGLIAPAAVAAVVDTWSDGDCMVLTDPDDHWREITRIRFARRDDGRCLADLFPAFDHRPGAGVSDTVPGRTAWFVSTIGGRLAVREAELMQDGRFEDYHLLHGLGAAMSEALAEEVHSRLEVRLPGVSTGAGPRSVRFSPGYSCCPDLSNQAAILGMLDAGRIGVSLSGTMQMVPELTVSAVVVAHPDAGGFL